MVAVTGVSGSGKSTLVNDILLRALMQRIYRSKEVPGRHTRIEGAESLDKVISIDQSPIGRTPRSNPATYTGVFDHIRRLFSATTEAKVRGYQPGRFSFNVKGGRCEACAGDGTIKIEMHFLPDVYVPCEVCKGARYNRDTLDITFKGKNIAEVLDMPCEEAIEFFANQPAIARHMQTLVDVGLGYVRLGQPAPTLSGGEAQRIKLASELLKRSTGHTIYLLDEPTTGLHFEDIRKLLTVLSRLVDQGNTVLVIEHNLDVIKTADWIIDLGPRGATAVVRSWWKARPRPWPRRGRATPDSSWPGCSTCRHQPDEWFSPSTPGVALRGRAERHDGSLRVCFCAEVVTMATSDLDPRAGYDEGGPARDKSLAELGGDLARQMTALVHHEIELATAEMTQKGRRAGFGAGCSAPPACSPRSGSDA